MQKQKIKCLLTGATSFSGAYIAEALIKNGLSVYMPLRLNKENYQGIKAQRLRLIEDASLSNSQSVTEFIDNCDISSEELVEQIDKIQPQIFINHGGYIENYRSPDFDFLKHLETNLRHIQLLIRQLKDNDCKLFIHSGSAFEPGGEYSKFGISPYGVAKKMVWDMLVFWCQQIGLPCTKIVIPNPYGSLENEDRLLPVFASLIKSGQSITLKGSADIRNNIRIEKLAEYYAEACLRDPNESPDCFVEEIKPVGNIESQLDFVKRALQEKPYGIDLAKIENSLVIVN